MRQKDEEEKNTLQNNSLLKHNVSFCGSFLMVFCPFFPRQFQPPSEHRCGQKLLSSCSLQCTPILIIQPLTHFVGFKDKSQLAGFVAFLFPFSHRLETLLGLEPFALSSLHRIGTRNFSTFLGLFSVLHSSFFRIDLFCREKRNNKDINHDRTGKRKRISLMKTHQIDY